MKRTLSIIGAGRVGKTLGKRLRQLGWRIEAVVTKSTATARAAVRTIGGGTPLVVSSGGSAGLFTLSEAEGQPREKRAQFKGALAPAVLSADVILFTTPDDALPAIAKALARMGRSAWRGKVALHTSATLDRSALAPLARFGAFTGSLHPMQAFGGKVIPKLTGVIFAIEGDRKARRVAQSIARSLGGITVTIATRDKPVYHAAAVMAAGSAYPTIEAGLEMLMQIGFTRARAMQTLVPLIRQILDNIVRIGPRAAWTGPLSRGDYAIVARHVRALRRYPREVQQAYAALALLAGRVLAKNPAAALRQINRALAAP